MKWLRYTLYAFWFLSPFLKIINSAWPVLLIDIFSWWIGVFIFYGALLLEVIPRIKWKINKDFNYLEQKKASPSNMNIFWIYTIYVIAWILMGFIFY